LSKKKHLYCSAVHTSCGDQLKVVTSRISEKCFEDLRTIQKEEQASQAEVIRRLLTKAISDWKKERVLRLLEEHKITLRKAASMADLSYVQVLNLAERVDSGYDLKELEKDMQTL
jgi:predicted HTH domain antitoxin